MLRGLQIFTSILILFGNRVCCSQCVTLTGRTLDAIEKYGVSAYFYVKMADKKQLVGKGTSNGDFSMTLPCNANMLFIEASGYRPLTIPVMGNTDKKTYFVEWSLYKIDKQSNDKPYFQSEQKHTILENTSTNSSTNTATRYFKIIDEQSRQGINADICLYYTTDASKKCYQVKQNSKGEKVIFNQKDIVGVVVKAEGYQSYNGNLIIENLDNQSSIYEIALSKTPSLLAFLVLTSLKPNAKLKNQNNENIPVVMIDSNHGFAKITTGASYALHISTGNPSASTKEYTIKKANGLYLASIDLQDIQTPPPSSPTASQTTKATLPQTQVLLFEQGKYELTLLATKTLDSLSLWLIDHPSFKVDIIGFTDNVGDPKINFTLSEFRAKVTYSYLINHGVSEKRLQWRAFGGEYPAALNDTEEHKKMNRRVEIKIKEVVSENEMK